MTSRRLWRGWGAVIILTIFGNFKILKLRLKLNDKDDLNVFINHSVNVSRLENELANDFVNDIANDFVNDIANDFDKPGGGGAP